MERSRLRFDVGPVRSGWEIVRGLSATAEMAVRMDSKTKLFTTPRVSGLGHDCCGKTQEGHWVCLK